MMLRKSFLVLVAGAAIAGGCREADGPLGGVDGQLIVSSDPEGARIIVDDVDTGLRTPDTVPNIGGAHDVVVRLDTGSYSFSYGARVVVQGIEPFLLSGPLVSRCSGDNVTQCYRRNRGEYSAGNIKFSVNALGATFLEDANGQGLIWPAGTTDTYVSTAMPLIAGKTGGRAVALGVYDIGTMAGRPAPVVTQNGGELRTDQKSWIVPITTSRTLVTIRGIEVRQQILIDPSQPDVALIRLTYRNITNSPLYQKLDVRGSELAGSQGISYDEVYIGFGLDPDIGTAADDIMTYDPELHAVIAYDLNFSENTFNSGAATSPGLIGLRMLSAPAGAPIILNGYGIQGAPGASLDWHASSSDEATGWAVLSGRTVSAPDDPDPTIGMLPPESDVRMTVSAGPYALRPAEELTIVVAVALAPPVPGTFTSGVAVAPGDPHDANRAIMKVAEGLRRRLTDAASLLPKMTN